MLRRGGGVPVHSHLNERWLGRPIPPTFFGHVVVGGQEPHTCSLWEQVFGRGRRLVCCAEAERASGLRTRRSDEVTKVTLSLVLSQGEISLKH